MGATAIDASARGTSKSPRKTNKSPPRPENASDADASSKKDGASNAEAAKPLAPPPRPGQQQGTNTPDYFSTQPGGGSLSLEPNPFEQSFGGGGQPETPGGTKLPSVHALTSPSSLLPGTSGATPFNWGGGSLRTGPLSPAMLSGPANDYFGDTHHIRGGFPTPNESSLRSGLTPGGSGSMFPAPSPNSSALFAQLASGGATPSTLDFHRTAMSAAAKRESNGAHQQQPQPAATSLPPQEMAAVAPAVKTEAKPASGPFDPHDNDAANGLFMLAQGRNGAQGTNQYGAPGAAPAQAPQAAQNAAQPPQMPQANGGAVDSSGRGLSVGSNGSDMSEQPKANARGKGKKNPPATNGRRKADEAPAKAPPNKKAKGNATAAMMNGSVSAGPSDDDEDDDMGLDDGKDKSKMTDEEKRKNFLERNRVAALKCRQRKKQWLANLQSKVEMFSNENDVLTAQITSLREEVVNLKTLLLAHKDCPVTQQQGMHGAYMNQVVEPFNAQMNPYGMAAPMPGQQVMAGQGPRRFS